MDGCSRKRAVDGLVLPRKANGLVSRENMSKGVDKNAPICSRISCSARICSVKGTQIGSMDNRMKSARPLFRSSSNGKGIMGGSSRTLSVFGNTKNPSKNTTRRQLSPQLDAGSSENSSVHDEPDTCELTPPRAKSKGGTLSVHAENAVSKKVVLGEASSSSRGSGRSCDQRTDVTSLSSGNTGQTARSNLGRPLRNLKCNSISDVVPSDSSSTRKINLFRKRNANAENSSSSRGDKMTRPVPEGRNQNTPRSISISDSRRQRNPPISRDSSVVSISTRRSAGYYGRTGRLGANIPPTAVMQVDQPATSADQNPSSAELSLSSSSSYSRPNNTIGRLRGLAPSNLSEIGLSRSLMNQDGTSRYNTTGIAEVLLALDRIDQDEELTYEQLAVLETNLFVSGMSRFYDQHRDMRLDIDNMSYEELLALEERMGTVSTALSEEALSRSLKTSIYLATNETSGSCLDKDDDVKCSICQEEFVCGDKLGSLQCQHKYHGSCIQQWLRMKNWCPICKNSAESPSQPQCS